LLVLFDFVDDWDEEKKREEDGTGGCDQNIQKDLHVLLTIILRFLKDGICGRL
jgi:hypothetical protein